MKKYVALARVSSREQEREGFSLDVQVDALNRYAAAHDGTIIRLFKIAETASKTDERMAFKEMVAYTKKHCFELDGLLFYKVDRAARNLLDYVELERLESDYDVPFISISQQTENNPAGRMMRRTLANMASFFTEQMAVDISQGIQRRVEEGYFPGKAPYGYRNIRLNGRSEIETVPEEAAMVQRLYEMYAYGNHTLDSIVKKLSDEGVRYRPSTPKWSRSKIHAILLSRIYIGDVIYRDNWYPGKHDSIIDRTTWDRVQALLGNGQHITRTTTYASNLITCGHCGHTITGELKIKKTNNGPKEYVYYRCSRYNTEGHPRTRVTEAELDRQVLSLFGKMKVDDLEVRDWIRAVLTSKTCDDQKDARAQRVELLRQETLLIGQQDRLVNMRMNDEIGQDVFATKQTEMRDRRASIKLQLETLNRTNDETADLAIKVFELSQTLTERWLTADYDVKRKILEIVCLNCRLVDVNLVPTMRKPFDVLTEGLVFEKSRSDRI